MTLFSAQQEKTTLQSIVAFTFKNHTVSQEIKSVKHRTDAAYLFSFNAHIYMSKHRSSESTYVCTHIYMHNHQFVGTCFCSRFYEGAS